MTAFRWPTDPSPPIIDFEQRRAHHEACTLLRWAVRSVEALYYLDDVDAAFNPALGVSGGHLKEVVELAHARWAAGTCITALDLAAAGLGRALGGHPGPRELDLGDFEKSTKAGRAARGAMPSLATQWIDGVLKDPQYQLLKGARDPLTHRWLPQHRTMGIANPGARLKLEIGGAQVSVRQLVIDARDLATTQIVALVNRLPSL